MALPSGQISLSQVNTELNISPASTLITMNDAAVRTLAGVGGSGTVISMSNLQGKSNRVAIPLTISAPAYNYDVYTNRGPTYSPGTSDITVTINPGVTVGSTSTGTYAFLVPSSFNPGDTVTVVNNGVVQGAGGNGGLGCGTALNPGQFPPTGTGTAGASGGTAVYVNRPTTITNNGTLAGGGGGGGGGGGRGGSAPEQGTQYASGGGGGGGSGFDAGTGSGRGASQPGAQGAGPGWQPGFNGTSPAGGAGGQGGLIPITGTRAGSGGTGGGRGAAGVAGESPPPFPFGTFAGSAGGGAGAYIVGNPFVTYPATGTRQGPSS